MRMVRESAMMWCILLLAATMACPLCMAQVGNVWQFPFLTSQPLTVPTWVNPLGGTGDILVDNFEYWDSPSNHGWIQLEPQYPVYGFFLGYGTLFHTVLDLRDGSRVLDVRRPSSVFLLGTPYEKHRILYNLYTPPSPGDSGARGIDLTTHPILHFQYDAPIAFEYWDLFEFTVIGTTSKGYQVTLRIRPVEPPSNQIQPGIVKRSIVNFVRDSAKPSMEVIAELGRCFIGGLGWGNVRLNIAQVIGDALADYVKKGTLPTGTEADWVMTRALQIVVSGPDFRLDDISFRREEFAKLFYPYLFKIGPRYAQLFEPYRYLFFADYDTGETSVARVTDFLLAGTFNDLFITDPNEIAEIWVNEYGADPNRFGKEPDHNVSALMGRDFIVDTQLPIFADPNFRLGKNPFIAYAPNSKVNQTLMWNATVGGLGASGVQFFEVTPLEINPYDGMPTYIPVYYKAEAFIAAYGKSFIGPMPAFMLESALYNAGFSFWPNIGKLDFLPQYFEDIILSIQVTNGRTSDVETFPISVVNYPVENYPPYIEDMYDRIFYAGRTNTYAVSVIDPDCTIFSLSGAAATSHRPAIYDDFRRDMDGITWSMSLNGMPNYQYGPWIQNIIDPSSGLISFDPRFEGAYNAILVARDPIGATGFASFTLFCVNRGTWLNHPPVVLMQWQNPIVMKAGEEIILTEPMIHIEDPDGDELACSSTIGACGCTGDGKFFWTFQTNFPGVYAAEIFIFDIRGGYTIVHLDIEVKPWWSF